MTYKYPLLALFTATALVGCKSDSTTAAAAISGLKVPANVEVIQDDSAVASNLAAANFAAYDSTGTDYTNAKAEVWINAGNWQQPLNMADMLVCIMDNSSDGSLPNHTYLALVDMSQCGNDQGGAQKGKKTRYAEGVTVTSRASNTAVQYATQYFSDGVDQNGDGDTNDAGEISQFVAQATITTSASTSNPYGVFTFNWNQDNAVAPNYSRGSLAFTDASTTAVGISFINDEKGSDGGGYEFTQWASGELNKDGSGGKLKVKQVDGATITNYRINFNATHANIEANVTGGSTTTTCSNLDESSMTSYVYKYNLYNSTTGALKNLNAGLQFVYGSDKDKRGYAGQYDHWADGASSATRKWWMWVEDGTTPTTIYKGTDTSISYTVSWSVSGEPTVTGLTLDNPVDITDSFTGITPAGTSGTKTDDLNYEGPGQLWGINWTGTVGVNDWKPDYNIADGTSLTDTEGTVYKVKQMGLWKTLATVASSNCTSIPLSAVDSYTSPTLTAVTKTWADKPTITESARVIHGVKQF